MATATKETVTGEGSFTCECGRTFTHGAWYTKHRLKCDGKPVATEGRIAANGAAAKSAKRSAVPGKKRHVRTPSAKVTRIPQKDVVAPISPVAFLAALRAERSKIDAAIAAVEALA